MLRSSSIMRPLVRSWQRADEGVHLAQDVRFVGAEDVVVGVRDADDVGGWGLRLEGRDLALSIVLIVGFHGGAGLRIVLHHLPKVVWRGEDDKCGNADAGEALLPNHDGDTYGRR